MPTTKFTMCLEFCCDIVHLNFRLNVTPPPLHGLHHTVEQRMLQYVIQLRTRVPYVTQIMILIKYTAVTGASCY